MSPKLHKDENSSLVKVTKNEKINAKSGLKTTKNTNAKTITFNDTKSQENIGQVTKGKKKSKFGGGNKAT